MRLGRLKVALAPPVFPGGSGRWRRAALGGRGVALCAMLAMLALGAVPQAVRAQDTGDEDETPTTTEQRRTDVQTPTETQTQTQTQTQTLQTDQREELRRAVSRTAALQLPGAVDPLAYRLGPGDLLQVSVWGGISRTMPLEVSPEGTVLLPNSGPMKVDGLTLDEARTAILKRLRPGFRSVSLDVRLLKPRQFLVYVTGLVKNEGAIQATGASRIADVVLEAEPKPKASMRQIEVVHRDGTREIADLGLFMRTSSQALDPWARDGDVIHVPIASSFVYVQGAVREPARYELGPRDSLRTLLALGGGLMPAADSTRALLLRWVDGAHTDSLWLDPVAVATGRINPVLRNGDRLYVYFLPQFQVQNEVTILGQVGRPGVYPIQVGRDHVSDVVRAAGGFITGADLAAVRVRRKSLNSQPDPELDRLLRLSRRELTNSEYDVLNTKLAGQREEYRIDWTRLSQTPELDILVLGGDVVQVDKLVNSVRVDGQVKRPGIVSFKPGRGVEDYIQASGGFSQRAWRNKIRVTRSVTGQTFLARDVQKLDPGDFIWVPERPDVTIWEQARTVLSAAAEVATVVLAFHAVTK